MSRLSGAVGAVKGFHEGTVRRDDVLSTIDDALLKIQRFKSIELPESQARVGLSQAQTGLVGAQMGLAEARMPGVEATSTMLQTEAQKAVALRNLLVERKFDVKEADKIVLKQAADTVKLELEKDTAEADIKAKVSEKIAEQKAAEAELAEQVAVTGGLVEEAFREAGGVPASVSARLGTLEAAELSPDAVRAQIRNMNAGIEDKKTRTGIYADYMTASIDQMEFALEQSKTLGVQEREATIANMTTRTNQINKMLASLDTELEDKAALDEMAGTVINTVSGMPYTNFAEMKFMYPLLMQERMAELRAQNTGTKINEAIKFTPLFRTTVYSIPDPLGLGGVQAKPSQDTLTAFKLNLPAIIRGKTHPEDFWNAVKATYVGGDKVGLFGKAYTQADKTISPAQDNEALRAIRAAMTRATRESIVTGDVVPTTVLTEPQPKTPIQQRIDEIFAINDQKAFDEYIGSLSPADRIKATDYARTK